MFSFLVDNQARVCYPPIVKFIYALLYNRRQHYEIFHKRPLLLRDRRGAHRRVRMDQYPGGRAVHAADLCDLRRVRAARRQARHGERAGVSAAGCGGRAGVRGLSRRVRVPDRHDRRIPRRLHPAGAHHHPRAGALGTRAVGVRAVGSRGAARVLRIRHGVVLAKCVLPFLLPDAIKLALATLLRARLYRRIPA